MITIWSIQGIWLEPSSLIWSWFSHTLALLQTVHRKCLTCLHGGKKMNRIHCASFILQCTYSNETVSCIFYCAQFEQSVSTSFGILNATAAHLITSAVGDKIFDHGVRLSNLVLDSRQLYLKPPWFVAKSREKPSCVICTFLHAHAAAYGWSKTKSDCWRRPWPVHVTRGQGVGPCSRLSSWGRRPKHELECLSRITFESVWCLLMLTMSSLFGNQNLERILCNFLRPLMYFGIFALGLDGGFDQCGV